jgi:hypothetical protein
MKSVYSGADRICPKRGRTWDICSRRNSENGENGAEFLATSTSLTFKLTGI